MTAPRTGRLVTLGCKVNQYEYGGQRRPARSPKEAGASLCVVVHGDLGKSDIRPTKGGLQAQGPPGL
jgi:hypothetical protein